MGARGPQPKPTNLRQLEGNPGRLPINHDEPEPEPGADPPDWLSKAALAEWHRVAPMLEACGVLTRADGNVLAVYCDAVANYADVTQQLAALPDKVLTDRYGRRPDPLIAIQKNYAELMLKHGGKLGMSPADRTGIKVSKPKAGKWARLVS